MNRTDALPYIGHCVDDCLSPRDVSEMPANARLVGWQCGFEPMFVAVWSYLEGDRVDTDTAIDIATDLLDELDWFCGELPSPPDYVI
ncbi:hypothetical protein H4CHR_02923 [Variovorax sp. PBS-H4]|uniref:hypothetical protein n=1 Tax=Variovorax sp. PBS-H4 TaxID=434008 RepID=UPI001315B469|nr:hypothetical protein [Variovorax sp. PBS-H4]VTU32006.1 hypothetical protein H4CHR_02923 [Variovorax sp. PBS-H4]